MKKKLGIIMIGISIMLVLTACGGKAYKEALEKGYEALEMKEYEDAYDHFTEAHDHKKKDPAKKGQETAQIMIDAWDAYEAGEWEDAITEASKVIEDNSDDKAITIVEDDAESLLEDAELTSELEADLQEMLVQAKTAIDENKDEEAVEILEEIIDSPAVHPALALIIEEAEDLLEEVKKRLEAEDDTNNDDNDNSTPDNDENTNDNDDANDNTDTSTNDDHDDNTNNDSNDDGKNNTTNNGNTNDNNSETTGLSEDEATSILRQELQLPADVNMNVDRTEGDDYIIQVYEVIGEGEGSHSATIGWYKINKIDGEWEEIAL